VVDGAGHVLLPSLVEPHAHLDKALTSGLVANERRDLAGAVEAWLRARSHFTVDEMAERARRAALQYLANGVTHIRTHADVGDGIRLRALGATLRARDELAGLVSIQVVAFAGLPLTGAGAEVNVDLLRSALALGADLVGGAPWLDPSPRQALEVLASAAAEYGVGLDLHVDETVDPAHFTLPDLVALAGAGFTGPITASHAVSLGSQPLAVQTSTAEALAGRGIDVVALPITNLYLQAREVGVQQPRGLTGLAALARAGVRVGGGGDNLRDPFNPLGRADPLEVASLLTSAGHLEVEAALEAVSSTARAILSGDRTARAASAARPLQVKVGDAADLVAVRGTTVADVVAAAPAARTVVHAGKVVSVTQVTRTIPGIGEGDRW
jgi:cytosine deaminase